MLHKIAQVTAVVTTAALSVVGVSSIAHAAPGDSWTGQQVVDVVPAATTQTMVLASATRIDQPGKDPYQWNNVKMVRNDKTGKASWVFCIQAAEANNGLDFEENPDTAGTPEARANMPKINRILADSQLAAPGQLEVTEASDELVNPGVYVLPKHKKDHVEIAAVQLAIWHYSDGYDFKASNTEIADQFYPEDFTGSGKDVTIADILNRYDALVAAAESNPLPNPEPEVSITPDHATAVAGNALFYDVEGKDLDGDITVTTNKSGIKAHPVSDGECDTDTVLTTLPSDGGRVCVISEDAADVTISVKGKSSPLTTHALFAYGAQGVITTAPEEVKDKAKGCWTPKPKHGLEVVKTNDPTAETESAFGDTITYGVKVTATGTAAETAVVVTDDIPGYGSNSSSIPTTYVPDSATCLAPPAPDAANCAVTTTETNGKVTSISWALGDLAPGASRTVTFKVTIDVTPTNPEGENPDVVLVKNCAAANSGQTPETISNCVENQVRVVTAVGDTDSSCISDTPYFDFKSTGWFANESVELHILDKDGNPVEVRDVTADATGTINGHELWPGFSVDPVTNVKTYPGLDVRPMKFFLTGSPTTNTVTVEYPPPAEKCDAALVIKKSNLPTGTVTIGDTINYTLAVTAPANSSFNQDNVVVTDYVPGHDPSLPDSGSTTYVDGSAGCTGTILPSVGKCDVVLTKNSAGDVTKITWKLGSMAPGQTTNAVFKVTVDEQPVTLDDELTIDNVGLVSSDTWPPTPSNKVTNPLVPVEVLDSNSPPPALAETGSDVLGSATAGLALVLLGLVLIAMTRSRDTRGRPAARVSWYRVN